MSAPSPISRTAAIRNIAETLAFACIGGLGFGLLGIPAGLLSGSIIAVAGAAIAGRPMMLPRPVMRATILLIGISLGAVLTPETLHGMATYPLSIAVLIVAMVIVSFAGATYLRVVHGWDIVAAYLASAPGGMSQVLILASELGSDLRAIAIVQSMRVVIVAVGLPAGLAAFGLVGHAPARGVGPLNLATVGELAILVAVSLAGAIAAQRLRFPGGMLFGAMITSAVLHGTGLIHAVFPWWLTNAAALALGAVIGARFTGMPLRLLLHYLSAAIGSFAVAVAISAVFAAGLIAFLSLRMAEVMIAFAPGSVDAMMLLALALHLDPIYVGAHHVTRIFLVALIMPFIARRHARRIRLAGDQSKPPVIHTTFED